VSPALGDVRLEGERVILRPIRPEDVELAFAQVHRRSEILDWLIWEGPETPEDMHAFYGDWRAGGADGYDYHFAVVGLEDGRFSGSLGARFAGHPHSGDLGYWIAVDRWGRGYASEAIFLATWLCFEHLEATLLYANVFVGNVASRVALEKSGFELAHVSRPVFAGPVREQWHMTLTRSHFRRTQAGRRPLSEQVAFSAVR
jgi:RimJ/RimL family protein N-acetyltransferase